MQHRLDELCAKHVAAAITGNPALPNAAAANPSLACVLTCVARLAERQRRVVDRYLPHLVKLLSRLTHEQNQASAAVKTVPTIQFAAMRLCVSPRRALEYDERGYDLGRASA